MINNNWLGTKLARRLGQQPANKLRLEQEEEVSVNPNLANPSRVALSIQLIESSGLISASKNTHPLKLIEKIIIFNLIKSRPGRISITYDKRDSQRIRNVSILFSSGKRIVLTEAIMLFVYDVNIHKNILPLSSIN